MKRKTFGTALAAALCLALAVGCSSSEGEEYGGIKTIETDADFKGNTGEVSLESGDTYAVITVKDYGEITCKLFPEAAPEGVQNFIDTAESGFYSGKIFHRVLSDFMIQGGSANGDGRSVEGEPEFNVEYNPNMRHYYGALCYANAGGINGTQFYIVNKKTYEPSTEESMKQTLNTYRTYADQFKAAAETASADEKSAYQTYYDYYESLANTAKSQLRALQDSTDEINAKYAEVGGVPYLDGGYTVFGQTVDGFDVIDAISAAEVTDVNSSDNTASRPVTDIVIEKVEIFTAD